MSSLIKNIKKIFLGNGVAQLIQFAFIPLSALLYTPEQFGAFGTMQAYSTALTIFISLQLFVAIPFEKNKEELFNLIYLSFKCIFITTIGLLFSYHLLNIDLFSVIVIFLASITAITNTLRSIIVSFGDFTKLSISYVFRSLIIVFAQAGLSIFENINGLILGLLLGEIIYSFLLKFYIEKAENGQKLIIKDIFKPNLKDVYVKFKDFSVFGSLLELTSVLIFYGPIFILSYIIQNQNYVGQYSFISRLIWPPVILFTTSISSALYYHLKKIDDIELRKITYMFFGVGFIIFAVSPFFSKIFCYVIEFFLKDSEWYLVSNFGYYTLIMAMIFTASIFSRVIIRYKNLQKFQLLLDMFFIMLFFIFLFFKNNYDAIGLIKNYVFLYSLYSFVLIIFVTLFVLKRKVNLRG
ncbi:MAG: oligosaccharide flippase family protein [Acinetobacter sp.]